MSSGAELKFAVWNIATRFARSSAQFVQRVRTEITAADLSATRRREYRHGFRHRLPFGEIRGS